MIDISHGAICFTVNVDRSCVCYRSVISFKIFFREVLVLSTEFETLETSALKLFTLLVYIINSVDT